MATCVLDDLYNDLEIKDRQKKESQQEMFTAKESEIETPVVASVPHASMGGTWDVNQLLLIGIVACILILSTTALVYALRH